MTTPLSVTARLCIALALLAGVAVALGLLLIQAPLVLLTARLPRRATQLRTETVT